MSSLVSTQSLHDDLENPNVKIIDATWFMPNVQNDPRIHYQECHLPGAMFFDLEHISDHTTDLPHMLPTPEVFAEEVGELGINNDDKVVVYDAMGMFSAPRVWWMFRTFGHKNVAVLDGGLPKWLEEKRPVERGAINSHASTYTATFHAEHVAACADVQAACTKENPCLLDARGPDRFNGEVPEPRAGMRSGHIPGSINMPYPTMLNSDGRTVRPIKELQKIFANTGITDSTPVITTCGSGITAAILALGLHLCGHDRCAVYDGSWAEWGRAEGNDVASRPIATAT